MIYKLFVLLGMHIKRVFSFILHGMQMMWLEHQQPSWTTETLGKEAVH